MKACDDCNASVRGKRLICYSCEQMLCKKCEGKHKHHNSAREN